MNVKKVVSKKDFSRVLESLPLDTVITIVEDGANGEFTCTGRIFRDGNDNLYVGHTRIFRDEDRYREFGGASVSLKSLVVE